MYPVNKNKGEISSITGNMIYCELSTKSQLLSPRMVKNKPIEFISYSKISMI